jgi:hypothetical protein
LRILFITTLLPSGGYTGSEVASQAFVDGLRAAGHEVAVVAYRRAGDSPPLHPDDRPAADRRIETRGAGPYAAFWLARAFATNQPYSVTKYVSAAYRRAVADELATRPPGLVVVDHAQVGWAVPDAGFGVPYVHIAHNVEHELHSQLAAAGGPRALVHARESRLIRRREEALCRGAAEVWTLNAAESDAMAAMGASRVRSFDLPGVADPDPPGPASCDVATLGSWTWRSNARGLEWFLREVRPLLPESLEVEVAGAASREIAAGTPGVTAHGRVPDAMAFLQSARVVAVPSVTGAGVQVKTLDAIASGRRVVASEVAMRGIDDPPPHVRVAADAEAFAAAVRESVEANSGPEVVQSGQAWARERRRRFLDQLRAAVGELAA